MKTLVNSRFKKLLLIAVAFLSVAGTVPVAAQNIPWQMLTHTVRPGVTFDAYLPDPDPQYPNRYSKNGLRPVILLIHGGGWGEGSRTELSQLAQYYAGWGFVTVTTDYRLAPANPWPAQYYDVRDVVYTIKYNATNLSADPNRIAAIGLSAGGQLAALLGVTDMKDSSGVSSRVNRVVTIAAPWDLTDPFLNPSRYPDTGTYGAIYNLFGQNPNIPALPSSSPAITNAQVAQATPASPFYYIDKNSVSTLVFHGDSDRLISVTQGQNACLKINLAGVNCSFVLMANTGHALPSDLNVILNQLNPFLNSWASSGL